MEKYYEIDKIAVVLFLPCFEVTSVYDYYESNLFVRQFIYEDNGCLVDIFRDKYIASIYDNGRSVLSCRFYLWKSFSLLLPLVQWH